MKFYRVIYSSIYVDEGEQCVTVTTFLRKENALKYLEEIKEQIKNQVEDLDDYCVEETEEYYQSA